MAFNMGSLVLSLWSEPGEQVQTGGEEGRYQTGGVEWNILRGGYGVFWCHINQVVNCHAVVDPWLFLEEYSVSAALVLTPKRILNWWYDSGIGEVLMLTYVGGGGRCKWAMTRDPKGGRLSYQAGNTPRYLLSLKLKETLKEAWVLYHLAVCSPKW